MSDKHGGGVQQQWQTQTTQATKAPTAATVQTDASLGYTGAAALPPPNPFYGGAPELSAYAAARFQAPPIHAAPSHSHLAPLLSHLEVTASNVPVPSIGAGGFVPPPFPHSPAAAAAVVSATSVLTPNPYAKSTTMGGGCGVNSFGLDRFQHFNPQQQFELSKFINAISGGSAAVATAPNNAIQAPPPPPPPPLHPPLVAAPIHSPASASGSGAITTTIAENVLNAIGAAAGATGGAAVSSTCNAGGNATPLHGRLMSSLAVKSLPAVADDDKMRRIQHVVESGVGDQAKQQILQILDRISTLRPVEKLLLYLRLPGEAPETDPLRHPQNPLGTRSEINHTINWVRSHLEHDPQVSIPKQDVYNDYIAYCERLDIKPLSTADFGKVMKQVFPGIRPRRLGTRGHSRYCYAAMRKTTKLIAPQLPQLGSAASVGSSGGGGIENNMSPSSADLNASSSTASSSQQQHHQQQHTAATDDAESWDIVKTWAESLLSVRVDSVKELAACIKNNCSSSSIGGAGAMPPSAAVGAGNVRTNAAQKKYTQREPKEKRFLADTGPLKKRRKKKRKGSSSSESSCNQPPQQQQQPPTTNNNNNSNELTNTSCTSAAYTAASIGGGGVTSEDEPKSSIKMIKVKQELIESPNFQRIQHLPASQMPQTAALGGEFIQQQQHHQLLPMNLATEQRSGGGGGVLVKAPPSAFSGVHRTAFAAAKNLTPKIMEMSAAAAAAAAQTEQMQIKEEVVDDYNPTNILCKKVRKAQQTKGFWTNSPTPPATNSSGNGGSNNSSAASSSSLVVPIITTTAASPPPPSPGAGSTTTIVLSSSTSSIPLTVSPVSNYLMGPPAQIAASTSPSSAATMSLLDASGAASGGGGSGGLAPKNASRIYNNVLMLRGKKQQVADATPPPDGDAANLPENLGLPRERVISICNMDKHELDDYFLPDECADDDEDDDDADSQDQDTELLQYFQTGDAEEKINSLDAAKLRNPTAMATQKQTTTTTTTATATATTTTTRSLETITTTAQTPPITTTMTTTTSAMMTVGGAGAGMQDAKAAIQMLPTGIKRAEPQTSLDSATASASSSSSFAAIVASAAVPAASAALGSASASLALMSQKHQQQQPTQNQQQSNNKRKISATFNHAYSASGGAVDQHHPYMMTPAARKNCIFLPISPNINSTNTSSLSTACGGGGGMNSNGPAFFASPGLTRLRPKPALSKQQSLDSSDSSDPMIGASRRRRSYVATMPSGGGATTSASAPPSPSPMQQQQQQQTFYGAPVSQLLNQWAPLSSGGGIGGYSDNAAADQNSLDLDLFSAAAAAAANANYQHAAGHNHHQQQQQQQQHNNQSLAFDADQHLVPLSETQRSQSVPLSQLQRIHSPAFSRSFQTASNYSGCVSMAPTPVPHDFADSTMLFSENSSSQHSLGGINNNTNAHNHTAAIKLEDDSAACVFAADSTAAILDEVDVSEILSSPDFVAKFSSIAPTNTATTTCSSSAGSSSGYSSTGACAAFGIMGGIMGGGGGGGGGIISRSVPSTPLPHHQTLNIFGNAVGGGDFYSRRNTAAEDLIGGGGCRGAAGQLSSSSAVGTAAASAFATKYGIGGGCSQAAGGRNAYDFSKSMPSTPITTPSFRYSPTDFNREFLMHSNTIDSLIGGGGGSSSGVGAADDGMGGGALDDVGVVGSGVLDVFGSNASDSSMVGADILGNL